MAVWTEELNTNYNYPHIDIFNRYRDGVLTGYQAKTHEGYVMYDPTANNVEIDPDTQEEVSVIYYYTLRGMPKTANLDAFPMIAVPRDSVDENYIFGVVDDNHEVM